MKYLPIVLVLAAGIALGVWIGRTSSEAPAPVASESAMAGSGDPVLRFETHTPPTPAGSPSPPPRPFASQEGASAAPPSAGSYAPESTPETGPPGFSQPIDAGPVFNHQFASAEKLGLQDAMLEAHRLLEREPRDDSWSYPLEAEIENSLIADTSMGNFRREHLECRSTMCEIRLSADGGEQIEALRQWTSDIQKFPWASRVVLSSSSAITSDTRMDALMIVTRAPPPPDGN